jgi:hypothetical protein
MKGDNVFQSVGFILATEGSRKQIFILSHNGQQITKEMKSQVLKVETNCVLRQTDRAIV